MSLPEHDAPEFSAVADVIGTDAARVLMARLGGTYLYVPKTPGPEHPISLMLGEEIASQLAQHYGSDYILVPRGRRTGDRARVLELRRTTDMSVKQIALATGYHVRQVLRILEDGDRRQMDLF